MPFIWVEQIQFPQLLVLCHVLHQSDGTFLFVSMHFVLGNPKQHTVLQMESLKH